MGQIATCCRGDRVSDLENELRRARLDCEEERRAREQLGGMVNVTRARIERDERLGNYR